MGRTGGKTGRVQSCTSSFKLHGVGFRHSFIAQSARRAGTSNSFFGFVYVINSLLGAVYPHPLFTQVPGVDHPRPAARKLCEIREEGSCESHTTAVLGIESPSERSLYIDGSDWTAPFGGQISSDSRLALKRQSRFSDLCTSFTPCSEWDLCTSSRICVPH